MDSGSLISNEANSGGDGRESRASERTVVSSGASSQ